MKFIILSIILILNLNARGIVGQKAPSFAVDTWVQDNDIKDINIDNYKGKVLYLYGFQSWCPACHSHGFPTLKKLSKKFKKDKKVAFVAIQTTFEGYYINTSLAASLIVKKYDLDMPVGHSKRDGKKEDFMTNYDTGGTPWIILVDKKGIVRFSNFHASYDELVNFIEILKNETY